MTSIITRSAAADFGAAIKTDGIQPHFTRTISITGELCDSDNYRLGIRFHALLRRIADHKPLDKAEKALLPHLIALRNELRSFGVLYLDPEVKLHGCSGLPNSRCDLLLTGGLAKIGVAEIKVTSAVPEIPLDAHLMQLAAYLQLIAVNKKVEHLWGCVAYLSFSEKRIRLFAYRDVTQLRRTATELLAA